jgi:archaellum component FlaF (FlaF/FlaG flagellin family)
MGLSVTASHVIWFIALTGLAGGALGAFFATSTALGRAEAAREAIDAERLRTFLADATWCYDAGAGSLVVSATNAGRVVLDAGNVTLLVDGAPSGGFAFATAAGATDLWAPGERATFTKTGVGAPPESALLATGHGATARAAKGC